MHSIPYTLAADDWIAYGQTIIPASGVINPACNLVGVEGAMQLPIRSDDGQIVIRAFGIEGYNNPGVAVISPVVTAPGESLKDQAAAFINDRQLMSCAAHDGSNEITGVDVRVKPGHTLNLLLLNGQKGSQNRVYGWYMRGEVLG